MQSTSEFAVKMVRRTRQQKSATRVDVKDIMDGAQCTAAYIAELSGELAAMASGASFANLAQLLSRAQVEAELWSRQYR